MKTEIKKLKDYLIERLGKGGDWIDIDTYKEENKTRYQIACYVKQVDTHNYLNSVSDALSIIQQIKEKGWNQEIAWDIQIHMVDFKAVFTFWN